MSYTSDIFVYVFLCSLQRQLDGFPIPIRPRPNLDGVWSTAQPLALSSSPWTFTATRLHSSYIRDWISSTSLILLPMTSHNRVSSFYSSSSDSNNGRDRIWSPDPLSQPTSDCQPVVLSSEQRQYPSFDNKNIRGILYDSSQTSLIDNGMTTSSFFDNKLKSSSMSSYAPRLSNFRLSKDEEAPMILFDQNGNIHKPFYTTFCVYSCRYPSKYFLKPGYLSSVFVRLIRSTWSRETVVSDDRELSPGLFCLPGDCSITELHDEAVCEASVSDVHLRQLSWSTDWKQMGRSYYGFR
ncbi:hypothetical protein QTP88_020226 [Uroleucon formosanum]